MKILKRNLLNCKEDIIVQNVNCLGDAVSQLSKKVQNKFPEVFNGYYHHCKTNKIEDLLGTTLICEADNGKLIANIFGQGYYGTDKEYIDYEAIKNALNEVREFAKQRNLSVAIPYKLGCDEKIDWNEVFDIITEVFADIPCNIYRSQKKKEVVNV